MLLKLGAERGDLPDEETEVWPENWPVLQVFAALQTQWALGGMGGVVGLRYEVLPAVLDLMGIRKKQRREVFDGLRVMEAEAMKVLNEP